MNMGSNATQKPAVSLALVFRVSALTFLFFVDLRSICIAVGGGGRLLVTSVSPRARPGCPALGCPPGR